LAIIRLFLFSVFIVSCHVVVAHSLNVSDNNSDEYIQKFKTKLTVKLNLGTNGLAYSIIPHTNSSLISKSNKSGQVNYIPYNPFVSGVSLNLYGLFSLSYKFNPFKSSGLQQSAYNDFSLGYSGRWLFLEGYYNQYNHLYYNTGVNHFKIIPTNFNTDFRFFSMGVNNFFVFNYKKYSYNAAFNQSAIQTKSAGSFVLINYYNYSQAVSDNGLIPLVVNGYYPTLNSLKTNRQITYSLAPGYAYTYAINNFYAGGILFVGPAWQMQRYTTFINTQYDAAISYFSRFKINIGYNTPSFFTGVYVSAELLGSKLKEITTRQNLYNYGFFIGGRLVKKKK